MSGRTFFIQQMIGQAGPRPYATVLLLLFMMLAQLGLGQEIIEISVKDTEGILQKGQFQVDYKLVLGDNKNLPPASETIQFSGKESEFIEIWFSNLKWDKKSFEGNIQVEAGDIFASGGLEAKRGGVGNGFVLRPSTGKKVLKFIPKKTGSSTIDIAYRIRNGATATADAPNSVTRKVNIKVGGSDPSTPTSDTPTKSPTVDSDPISSPNPKDPTETGPSPEELKEEVRYWDEVVEAMDIPAFERYLERYEDGQFAQMARDQIKRIKDQEKKDAQATKPPPPPKTTPPKAQPSSSASAEDVLWAKIKKDSLPEDCEQYLADFENGKYGKQVNEILIIVSPIKIRSNSRDAKNDNRFIINLQYVNGRPQYELLSSNTMKEEDIVLDFSWSVSKKVYSIEIASEQNIDIRFYDDRSPRKYSVTLNLDTKGEPFKVETYKVFVNDQLEADSIQFEFSGGEPPYYVEFLHRNQTKVSYRLPLNERNKINSLNISEILEQVDISDTITSLNGTYFVRLVDKRESIFKDQPQNTIRIPKPAEGPPWTLIIIGSVILLGIIIVNIIFRQRRKAAVRKIEERKRQQQEQRESATNKVSIQKVDSASKSAQPRSVSPPPVSMPSESQSPPPTRKSNFKITKKQPSFERAVTKRKFNALGSSDYILFDLKAQWEHPAVMEVYMHHECLKDIDTFIHEHNVKEFEEEKNDMIPEIGGFLMGTFELDSNTGQHRVSLEKFQPITADAQDLYKVEFGVTAWAELANIQDTHEDLTTIGWFHTHPGHGLFLSQPDLRIHEGFFKNQYQLAMEIDTKSARLDTAFFSRDVQGTIYNSRNRISSAWFSWKDYIKQGQIQ